MSIELSCEASILRGRLKHSWLENQVFNKTAHDVIEMSRGGSWQALEIQFPERIRESYLLADSAVDGFSPAQLVERLTVFSHLSKETRLAFCRAVHVSYLSCTGIDRRVKALTEATRSLSDSLDNVRALWRNQNTSALSSAWHAALSVAEGLYRELSALPQRIVLP